MKKILLVIIFAASGLIARAQTSNPILNQDLARDLALADTCFAHQQYQEAYNRYNSVKDDYPRNGKIYRRMGYILSLDDNPSSWQQTEAIKMFKKAVEIDPTDKVSYYEMGLVYMVLAKHDALNKAETQNKALAGDCLKKAADLGSEDAKAAIRNLNAI